MCICKPRVLVLFMCGCSPATPRMQAVHSWEACLCFGHHSVEKSCSPSKLSFLGPGFGLQSPMVFLCLRLVFAAYLRLPIMVCGGLSLWTKVAGKGLLDSVTFGCFGLCALEVLGCWSWAFWRTFAWLRRSSGALCLGTVMYTMLKHFVGCLAAVLCPQFG